MGQEISRFRFERADFERFQRALQRETELLLRMASAPRFSTGPMTAGFELEAWLVDRQLRPNPINERFLSRLDHPLVSPELARFNVEFGCTPRVLQADALSAFQSELQGLLQLARDVAEKLEADVLTIGILPTLLQSDLVLANMSPLNRFYALNEQILKTRGKPLTLDIGGHEHIHLDHPNVMPEAATTSFQIHLKLPFEQAHRYYNASIVASAPVVAVAANSPYLFGRNLWEETRIPVFEQAIQIGGFEGAAAGPVRRVTFGSGYCQRHILEIFQENLAHFPVLLPVDFDEPEETFPHLRLHNGTIWRWNRPLIGFDADGTPHVRLEHRTPAAPPSLPDALANAAFYFGLTRQLADEWETRGELLPFSVAKDNFYRAARLGVKAVIQWLDDRREPLQRLMLNDLLPRAEQGLARFGLDARECADYLGIVRERIECARTGSDWQHAFMATHAVGLDTMLSVYLSHQRTGIPVHRWPIP